MDNITHSTFVKTGSTAQDALRLGFQTTCEAGIVKLLKINDITVEACESFKERHLNEVKETLADFVQNTVTTHTNRFIRGMVQVSSYKRDSFNSIFPFLGEYNLQRYRTKLSSQIPREFTVEIIDVDEPYLDIIRGTWNTKISYKLTSFSWQGIYSGERTECDREEEIESTIFSTSAKVCVVKYIPYDDYSERYIPDPVVDLAWQATQIGLTKLLVARPEINDATALQKDPIIVGHIKDQMYLIAMFGQDVKDHMSFNM